MNRTFVGLLLAGTILSTPLLSTAHAAGANPSWEPTASERLIKLPGNYLKKAIDRDFAGSELASAMGGVDQQLKDKTQTLGDLQKAVEQAQGDVRTELRHQFLAEKREFIVLNGSRQELKRKHLQTKVRFYEKLIQKLEYEGSSSDPSNAKFIEDHKAARERFESSVANIDLKLLNATAKPDTKYSREYNKNMAAIDKLAKAINQHPLSRDTEMDGKPVDKKEYLRGLISDAEAELALVEQEEQILGYMAKLVALDAMALSDELGGGLDGPDAPEGGTSVTSAVEFFVGN